jgi:hypothetical protein
MYASNPVERLAKGFMAGLRLERNVIPVPGHELFVNGLFSSMKS